MEKAVVMAQVVSIREEVKTAVIADRLFVGTLKIQTSSSLTKVDVSIYFSHFDLLTKSRTGQKNT